MSENEEAIQQGHQRMQELDSEHPCSDERLDAVLGEYQKGAYDMEPRIGKRLCADDHGVNRRVVLRDVYLVARLYACHGVTGVKASETGCLKRAADGLYGKEVHRR